MKIRSLVVPCIVMLGFGLVLALLWVLDGEIAQAAAVPALGEVRRPEPRPLGASGGVITVCLSGGCDHTSIQAAVDAAGDGDVIKVATGTYTDVNNYGGLVQVVYVSKPVSIRGGYTTAFTEPPDPEANPTTLDAQGQGRGLFITGDISPTIEGLCITGGNANGLAGGLEPWGSDSGSGMYIITATATISRCRVFSNTAYVVAGGGLYLENSAAVLIGNTVISNNAELFGGGLYLKNSDATLRNNFVSANVAWWDGAGSGLYLDESDAKLISNTITANTNNGWGGGLHLSSSAAIVSGNTIAFNVSCYGGGMYLSRSAATLSGNTIVGNDACVSGGGLSVRRSDATLSGNTIVANTADDGGGLRLSGSDATLTNNVIADNQAASGWRYGGAGSGRYDGGAGSGLYIRGSSPRLLHTTIARNSGGDGHGVYVTGHSSVAMTNTILVSQTLGVTVTAGNSVTLEATLWGSGAWANGTDWGGTGTIITGTLAHNYWGGPDFVDPGGGDYHIGSESAAIDRGVDAGVTVDIDGGPRPVGKGYDLGADEYPVALPNQAPYIPSDPIPADDAADVPLNRTLSWRGGDPDGDPVTFTVAFGASDPPPVVGTTTLTGYTPELITATTYYWAISATDGISTSVGPTWSFTTVGLEYIYLPLVLRQSS